MNSLRTPGSFNRISTLLTFSVVRATVLALTLQTLAAQPPGGPTRALVETSRNLVLWDTSTPIVDKLNPSDRSGWKIVPNDLMLLEANPPKASSDPGYYGREYAFSGDAVVETPTLTAVFWSAKGCLRIYSKPEARGNDQDSAPAAQNKIVDLVPVHTEDASGTISHVEVVRNADDEVVLKVSFSPPGSVQVAGMFSFDRSGIVEVKPVENMKLVRLSGSIEYGVVPGFIGDDLIFGGAEGPAANRVTVPSGNMLLGLLQGESAELVVSWPKGKQRLSLQFAEQDGKHLIESVDFDDDRQSFYLAPLSAPGIWHKEMLKPDYLEKDVKIEWKRPFPARWKTQLFEEELKTTYAFRESRGEIWRGVAGSYVYPVWFAGDDAFFHLGKKVQPKGESIIYCLEGRDTPPAVLTPADILKQTLGRQAAEPILDLAGRKLRTHHRRGGAGVRRACTCGCTEAIEAVFKAGEEVGQKDYIKGALGDMIYFVHCHVDRINEYRQFADGVLKTIEQEKSSSPQLKPFLENLEEIARQIPQECEVQKDNMKSFAYADELVGKTMALTAKKDPGNMKVYMELLKAWRDMGGAQDYVLAKCHVITRSLYQAAGYGCAELPGAVPLAENIRALCRQTLRNPDGYETWVDY